jgi:hypothetical protein
MKSSTFFLAVPSGTRDAKCNENELELLPLMKRFLSLECGFAFLFSHAAGCTHFETHCLICHNQVATLAFIWACLFVPAVAREVLEVL